MSEMYREGAKKNKGKYRGGPLGYQHFEEELVSVSTSLCNYANWFIIGIDPGQNN